MMDKRYLPQTARLSMKPWKTIIEYQGRDIKKSCNVPKNIIQHWEKDKSMLEYASFRGLTKKDSLKIISLAKCSKIRLGVNVFGDIVSYKIVKGFRK